MEVFIKEDHFPNIIDWRYNNGIQHDGMGEWNDGLGLWRVIHVVDCFGLGVSSLAVGNQALARSSAEKEEIEPG